MYSQIWLHADVREHAEPPEHHRFTQCHYRGQKAKVACQETIFTSPIDEYLDCCLGKLPYRSSEFKHQAPDKDRHLPKAVVNFQNDCGCTHVTGFKYLLGRDHPKTSIAYDYPCAEGDPYYPIPRPECTPLYNQDKSLAGGTCSVRFVGRLPSYKYYKIDQVAGQSRRRLDLTLGVRTRPGRCSRMEGQEHGGR